MTIFFDILYIVKTKTERGSKKNMENIKQKLYGKIHENKKGFTLMEMVVVVAIIAVFVGAAVMYLGKNTEDAKIARAKEDIKIITSAAIFYTTDTGKTLNAANMTTVCETLQKTETLAGENREVGPWLKSCPIYDPWNNEYTFQVKTTGNSPDYIMYTKTSSGQYISSTDLSKFLTSAPSSN